MIRVEPRAKPLPGVCMNRFCNRSVVWDTHKWKTKYCNTCRGRLRRIADPVKYSWQNKKNQCAKRKSSRFPKGIPFTITLEFWRKWCHLVKFVQNANGEKILYDCDRILETEGYHDWNIQKLRRADNVKKYHKVKKLHYEWWSKSARVKTEQETDYSNDPNSF